MGLDMYLTTNSKRCKKQAEQVMDKWEKDCWNKWGVAICWRKANAIHKWFVDNVQNGEDDCGTYEVSVNQLLDLADACVKVLNASKLVEGKVISGYGFDGEKMVPHYEDGLVIEDATVANELLPTEDGFFFGSQDYNEWYLEDVRRTNEAIMALVKGLKPDEERSYMWVHEDEPDWYVEFHYHSSW